MDTRQTQRHKGFGMSEQLEQWLLGNPIHGEQCCPDFSCCRGVDTIAPKEVRERFCKAERENDEKTKMEMLGMFLGNALSGKNVYVAGTEVPKDEQ